MSTRTTCTRKTLEARVFQSGAESQLPEKDEFKAGFRKTEKIAFGGGVQKGGSPGRGQLPDGDRVAPKSSSSSQLSLSRHLLHT